jgi:hypothetical protein
VCIILGATGRGQLASRQSTRAEPGYVDAMDGDGDGIACSLIADANVCFGWKADISSLARAA